MAETYKINYQVDHRNVSFGAESHVFQVATQKFKDQDI